MLLMHLQNLYSGTAAGSHTVLALVDNGFRVTIFDSFENAFERGYERMRKLAGDKAGAIKLIKVMALAQTSCPCCT